MYGIFLIVILNNQADFSAMCIFLVLDTVWFNGLVSITYSLYITAPLTACPDLGFFQFFAWRLVLMVPWLLVRELRGSWALVARLLAVLGSCYPYSIGGSCSLAAGAPSVLSATVLMGDMWPLLGLFMPLPSFPPTQEWFSVSFLCFSGFVELNHTLTPCYPPSANSTSGPLRLLQKPRGERERWPHQGHFLLDVLWNSERICNRPVTPREPFPSAHIYTTLSKTLLE